MCSPQSCPQDSVKAEEEEKEDFKYYDMPSLGDPCWEKPSALLLEYLQVPHTVKEIFVWGKENGMLVGRTRNTLAYLSFHGRIDYDSSLSAWKKV